MKNKIPEDWITDKLGNLGVFKSAGADKKENSSETPIGLVNYMDVYRNTKLDNTFEWMRVTAKPSEIQKCSLLKGDILFTPSSETPDDIGHTAVVVEDLNDAIFSYHLVRLRLHNQELLDLDFRRYFLNHYLIAKYFHSRATGITRYTLSRNDFRNCIVSFPKDVNEQRTIASILTKVDQAIAATKNSIAKAERLKKSLMQNLLSGKLKPDGTWRKEDEFYKDEKFGNVPNGWIIKKGNKLTDKITKGQSPKWQGFEYQTEGTLFVTSENVLEGRIDVSSPKYLPKAFNDKMKGSQLQKNDILINIVGASIGRCAVFNLEVESANTNQAVCVFRPNEESDSSFLAFYIQWSHTQYRLLGNQVETARANLSLGDFRKFKFIIPETKEEQQEISNSIGKVDRILYSKQTKIKKLERLKKALMQNLLTGKVRVKVKETANG